MSFAKPCPKKCAQVESLLIQLGSEKRAQLGSLVKFPEKVHNWAVVHNWRVHNWKVGTVALLRKGGRPELSVNYFSLRSSGF